MNDEFVSSSRDKTTGQSQKIRGHIHWRFRTMPRSHAVEMKRAFRECEKRRDVVARKYAWRSRRSRTSGPGQRELGGGH